MGLQPCYGGADCTDPRWCRAFWSKDPGVRGAVVAALTDRPRTKKRQPRPLSTTDFTYTHPGALRRANPKAIVVGFACASCGEWRDRIPVGRTPRYCSPRCRQAAWREAA